MSVQLRPAEHLPIGRADRRQGAAAEADEDTVRGRVVPDVVGIVAEANRPGWMEFRAVDELDAFALAIGDGNGLGVRNDGDPLWFSKPWQAFEVSVVFQFDHCVGVVSQRRY